MNLGLENETLEFKKSTRELKEAIISLSAMLNKSGYGLLYFGVKNNGQTVGQEIGQDTLKDISQAVANHIKPQIIPILSIEYVNELNRIKVEVKGEDKPYSAYGKYYIRSGDEDGEISPLKLKELMTKDNLESIVKIESNNQNLSFTQLKGLYLSHGLTINDAFFEHNLRLRTSDNKYNLMADILSDNNVYSIKVARNV